jgi:hypothetical protein
VGLRPPSLEDGSRCTGCCRSCANTHGGFGLGAASRRVPLPATSVLLAVVLGRQIFPESWGCAHTYRAGYESGGWRVQPWSVGGPARTGQSGSVVGGVGSRGCSLGWDQSSFAVSAALNTQHSDGSPARLIIQRKYEYGSDQRGNAKAENQPLAGTERQIPPASPARK